MIRHFTATTFVLDPAGRVLLLWHKKFGKWMPPGGHVDENELPEEAARRECKEETGLDVDLVRENVPNVYERNPHEGRMMTRPYAMLLEEIPAFAGTAEKPAQSAHQHMDFIFVGRPADPAQALVLAEEEADHVKWFTREEVEALPDNDIYANVREIFLRILTE